MNLLNYRNRFKQSAFIPTNVSEVQGYLWALEDLLKFLEDKTEFNPAKRMVDSVELLDAITDTNSALTKLYQQEEKELQSAFNDLAGVNLGSGKVNQFLKEQTESDIPQELFTSPTNQPLTENELSLHSKNY